MHLPKIGAAARVSAEPAQHCASCTSTPIPEFFPLPTLTPMSPPRAKISGPGVSVGGGGAPGPFKRRGLIVNPRRMSVRAVRGREGFVSKREVRCDTFSRAVFGRSCIVSVRASCSRRFSILSLHSILSNFEHYTLQNRRTLLFTHLKHGCFFI